MDEASEKSEGLVLQRAERRRLTRAEIEPAALALLQRHGPAIMATARRWAATPEDAEDAYQRGVEILLTRAPATSEEQLLPWLRTVVKHEAWALQRQRWRASPISDDGELPDPPSEPALTHEQTERLERLRLGAEAMRRLKPQEVRALLLKAEGYSYKEIQAATGWSYTKVRVSIGPVANNPSTNKVQANIESRVGRKLSRLGGFVDYLVRFMVASVACVSQLTRTATRRVPWKAGD